MQTQYFFMLLLPLISYVVIERKWGIIPALITALGMTSILLAYEFYYFNEIDHLTLIEAGLFMIMGGLAILLKNDRFFKLQPVLVAVIFAVVLAYYQIFDQPLLVKLLPKMQLLLPNPSVNFDALIPLLNITSLHLIFLLLIHAGLMLWAAIKYSTMTWMWVRLSIFPLLALMTLIDSWYYSYFIYHI